MRRSTKFVLLAIGGTIISASLVGRVFSYDTNIAHPGLTGLAAEAYNLQVAENKLSPEEIGWLRLGAIEEDYPFRWMNHFYDPVHNVGLKGSYDTAKKWSQNSSHQAGYSLGDQSWQRAIYNFQQGNRKQAFIALGHVLHLIEDMTVPAHTRDDAHPEGDPYEQWAKNNFKSVSGQFIYFDNINQYFDYLAGYSNNNFVSKDTIDKSQKFAIPDVNTVTEEGGYLYSKGDGRNFKLVAFRKDAALLTREYYIDDYVNSDYFSILAPKAVGAAAGVIKLFFEEVSKGEVKKPTFFQTNLLGVLQKPVGGLVQVAEGALDGAQKLWDNLKSKSAPETLAQSGGTVSENDQASNSPDATVGIPTLRRDNPQLPTPNNQKPITKKQTISNNTPTPIAPSSPSPVKNTPTTPQVTLKPVTFLAAPGYFPASSPTPADTTNTGQDNTNTSTTVNNETIEQSTSTPDDTPDTSTTTPDASPTSTPPAPPAPPADVTPPPAPILDNLFTEIIYTTSSGANIFGTVSTDTVKIFSYFSATPLVSAPNSEQEGIAPSSTRFDLGAVFSSGHNYFYFSAADEANNTSTLSLPAHFVFDTAPPAVPTVTIDNQTNASSTNLHLTVSSSDALSPTILYDVAYRQSTTSTWQELAAATTTSQFDFVGTRGESYFFRARAQDGLGNASLWSDENVSSTPTFVDWGKEVVISEVAWAGNSAQYSNDEWLELYNNTESDIDLRQWKIMVSGRQISWSSVKNSIIPARGYFLLERTYDNNLKNVAADIIYTLQYGFKNTGEKIELLKPNGVKVDEVDASAGWFGGDNIKYRSMERTSSTRAGNDPNNWQSNQGPRVGPRSYNGGYIYGSPRQSNFGFIMLADTQEEASRTLTAANNPYVLTGYTVPAGKGLVIEAGVVIKAYRGAKIEIYGALEAKGGQGQPVIFTSGKDQSFSDVSLNTIIGSWTTTTPAVKDWQGLWFRAGASGTLDFAELRFAGYDFRPTISNLLYSQALRADSAVVNISNSNFNGAGDTLVYLNASTSTISGSSFQNGILAVDAQQSALTLTNSSFTNFSNSRGPVNIKGSWPSLSQLTFSGNALDMAYAESITLEQDATYPRELNYLVLGGELLAPSSTTFTLEPGATVNMAKYGVITVRGALAAPGTAENPITLQPSPSNTYWGHVKFDGSASNLSYVNFNRGGLLTAIPAELSGAVLVYNSTVTLDNVSISDARSPGNSIQAGNSTVTIRNSQIIKTEKYAGQDTGIKVSSGQLNLDNVILSNHNIGVQGVNSGSLPGLDVVNTPPSNFVNVDYPWQPAGWFVFPTSTP